MGGAAINRIQSGNGGFKDWRGWTKLRIEFCAKTVNITACIYEDTGRYSSQIATHNTGIVGEGGYG